jgi:hypothetical protein
MSLIQFWGGVDPEAVIRVMAATLLAIFFVGAHAIYFSATTRSTLGALVQTYWWLAIWLVGVPAAGGFILAGLELRLATEYFVVGLAFINPVGPFVVALIDESYTFLEGRLGAWFFPFTFLLPLAWSLFVLWRAVRRLRAEPARFALSLKKGWGALARRNREKLTFTGIGRFEQDRRHTWFGYPVENPFWLRARLARVYDREGIIGSIQWVGWAVAGVTFLLVAVIDPGELDEEEASMAFLGISWGVIGLLAALFAGTSLVGDRRRGFLELALTTPLTGQEIFDGAMLAVWQHVRRLYWLPWALSPLFWLAGASTSYGLLFSLISATLYGAFLVLAGVAASLAARTVAGALVCTFILPLITIVGIVFPAIEFRGHGPVFWVLSPVLLVLAWYWTRRSLNAASVSCYLTAVFLVMVTAASAWTYPGWWGGWRGGNNELPLLAMHPGVLVLIPLDGTIGRWFRGLGEAGGFVFPCYWVAVLISFVWCRRWVIRRFDELADRVGTPMKVEVPVSAISTQRAFSPVERDGEAAPQTISEGGAEKVRSPS